MTLTGLKIYIMTSLNPISVINIKYDWALPPKQQTQFKRKGFQSCLNFIQSANNNN